MKTVITICIDLWTFFRQQIRVNPFFNIVRQRGIFFNIPFKRYDYRCKNNKPNRIQSRLSVFGKRIFFRGKTFSVGSLSQERRLYFRHRRRKRRSIAFLFIDIVFPTQISRRRRYRSWLSIPEHIENARAIDNRSSANFLPEPTSAVVLETYELFSHYTIWKQIPRHFCLDHKRGLGSQIIVFFFFFKEYNTAKYEIL